MASRGGLAAWVPQLAADWLIDSASLVALGAVDDLARAGAAGVGDRRVLRRAGGVAGARTMVAVDSARPFRGACGGCGCGRGGRGRGGGLGARRAGAASVESGARSADRCVPGRGAGGLHARPAAWRAGDARRCWRTRRRGALRRRRAGGRAGRLGARRAAAPTRSWRRTATSITSAARRPPRRCCGTEGGVGGGAGAGGSGAGRPRRRQPRRPRIPWRTVLAGDVLRDGGATVRVVHPPPRGLGTAPRPQRRFDRAWRCATARCRSCSPGDAGRPVEPAIAARTRPSADPARAQGRSPRQRRLVVGRVGPARPAGRSRRELRPPEPVRPPCAGASSTACSPLAPRCSARTARARSCSKPTATRSPCGRSPGEEVVFRAGRDGPSGREARRRSREPPA